MKKISFFIILLIFSLVVTSCYYVVGIDFDEDTLKEELAFWKENDLENYSFTYNENTGRFTKRTYDVVVRDGQKKASSSLEKIASIEDVFDYVEELYKKYVASGDYKGDVSFGVTYDSTYHYPNIIKLSIKETRYNSTFGIYEIVNVYSKTIKITDFRQP